MNPNPFSLRRLRARAATLAPAAGQAAELVRRTLARQVPTGAPADPKLPQGASFTHGSFTGSAGTRPYRLFVPTRPPAAPALVVMLHGCTQTAEDFAAGTRMNELAQARGFLVLYPVQIATANAQRCWNWFNPIDRAREGGEAALIAGMVRAVAAQHRIDPKRIFAAGLSAGGAQAAALGAAYPDLFAGVGIHSGLACGAASDVASAFAAMRGGRPGTGQHQMRTIIFHGDQDHTVNRQNAEEVASQVAPTATGGVETTTGTAGGGLAYTRTIQRDAASRPAIERWTVHTAGHAWSGGSPAGSYTEPRGPDASRAMLDFFLA